MAPTERWLLMFHAASEPLSFTLPAGRWLQVLDSAAALVLPQAQWGSAASCVDDITLFPRSLVGLVQLLGAPTLPLAPPKP